MRKFFISILCFMMLVCSFFPVNIKAMEIDYSEFIEEVHVTTDGIEITLSLSEEEVQKLSREELDEIHRIATESVTLNNVNLTSDIQPYSRPTYYNEYGEAQRKSFEGFAGNQNPLGYCYPTGGGFYFSDSGGPSVSIGVSFAGLGGFWDLISVSVTLGNSSTTGRFVNVPNTTDRFKLYVRKIYDCKPYITYYTNSSGQTSVYAKGISKIWLGTDQWAEKVS